MKLLKIASGVNGNIFRVDNKLILKRTKERSPIEYRIQKRLYSKFPSVIIRPYSFKQNPDSANLLMNFVNGQRPTPTLDIVLHVLFILKKIREKFPTFRHNDLHLGNVMVTKTGIKILDFGFANMEARGYQNPRVQSLDYKESYGIFPKNDPLYDAHFFLNSLAAASPSGRRLVKTLLPSEYIGKRTSKVLNSRLRADTPHTNLPSLDEIIFLLSSKWKQGAEKSK
jgi:serine/threonine protein kinase